MNGKQISEENFSIYNTRNHKILENNFNQSYLLIISLN